MKWLQNPNNNNEKATCGLHTCWSRNTPDNCNLDNCIIRLCGTKFCIIDL